jgi:hypothetical protein
MKQSGGFSCLGIFYGLLISIGGSILFALIIAGAFFFNYVEQDYTREQLYTVFVQKLLQEPIPIIILLSGFLCLFLGSFVAANAAGSSSGMAFVHAIVVGLVNFLLYLLDVSESRVLPNGEVVTHPYAWVGVIAILPVALFAGLLSVLTAEQPSPAQYTYSSGRDGYSSYCH